VNTDTKTRRLNPDFVLNQSLYQNASILLARDNFGCGSSREHAVWAFRDYGIRALIAPSFADIFYNNCFTNGILPITLPAEDVDRLFALCQSQQGLYLSVNLQSCEIYIGEQKITSFTLDEARRQNLLQGIDDIALTLSNASDISAFEQGLMAQEPWLFKTL
jgi:3-isopropylmalate/(R)-2-methylmalate dehydratase small subunit